MSYKREIELVFDIASFQEQQPNAKEYFSIDLWYIGANRQHSPVPSTPEKEFFLGRIRDHVRAIYAGSSGGKRVVKHLLDVVSTAWEKANVVGGQIRMMDLTFPTIVRRVSDAEMEVVTSLLVVPVRTKVEVLLKLRMAGEEGNVKVEVVPDVRVVYGEGFNIGKMREFLVGRVGKEVVVEGEGGEGGKETPRWSDVVVEMHRRLVAKGVKAVGGLPVGVPVATK